MARTYRDMIRKLLRVNGVRCNDVKTYNLKWKGPFQIGSPDSYFNATFEVNGEVTYSQLQTVSRLLGTNDISVTGYDDGRNGSVVEISASYVDRDSIKIQIIYAEANLGQS